MLHGDRFNCDAQAGNLEILFGAICVFAALATLKLRESRTTRKFSARGCEAHSLLPSRRGLAAASYRYVESVTSQRYDGALMTGPAVGETRRIQLCAGPDMWLNKRDDFHRGGPEIRMRGPGNFFGHHATLTRARESYRTRGVRKCNWE